MKFLKYAAGSYINVDGIERIVFYVGAIDKKPYVDLYLVSTSPDIVTIEVSDSKCIAGIKTFVAEHQ